MECDDGLTNQFSNTVIVDDHVRNSVVESNLGSNYISSKKEKVSKNIFKNFVVVPEKKDNLDIITEKIWIPKAICLISTYPFYDFMSGILLDLFYTVFHDHNT